MSQETLQRQQILGSVNNALNELPGVVVSEADATGSSVWGTQISMRGFVTNREAEAAAGTEVTVATRPERMEVQPASEAAAASSAGWHEVSGTIHQGTYLGDQTEYRIETEHAGEVIVRRQNAAGTGGALGAGPGDAVVVRWHEEANLILIG